MHKHKTGLGDLGRLVNWSNCSTSHNLTFTTNILVMEKERSGDELESDWQLTLRRFYMVSHIHLNPKLLLFSPIS